MASAGPRSFNDNGSLGPRVNDNEKLEGYLSEVYLLFIGLLFTSNSFRSGPVTASKISGIIARNKFYLNIIFIY